MKLYSDLMYAFENREGLKAVLFWPTAGFEGRTFEFKPAVFGKG